MIGLDALLSIGGKLLDKLIPDPQQKAAAQLQLATLAQNGELEEMKAQLSAILAEAQSADPWTSRARPSFLYVMYIMILAAIPMGLLFAFRPDVVGAVINGLNAWLTAIPDQLWWLFGTGYLGYTGARSFDKRAQGKAGKSRP